MREYTVIIEGGTLKIDHLPPRAVGVDTIELLYLALNNLSHVLPRNHAVSGDEWACLIEAAYDCTSDTASAIRIRTVVDAIRAAMPDPVPDILRPCTGFKNAINGG